MNRRPFLAAAAALLTGTAVLLAGSGVLAQIESGERGIAPHDSSQDFEVAGVEVDASGKSAQDARLAGWREAQRRGWKVLWSNIQKRPLAEAPGLPDSTLDAMVSGILVEREQIGPTRYIARLGVLFDRSRAGQLLGVQGRVARSAPVLVIPVLITGGTATSLEMRNEWQRAWAQFRTGSSPIDYVRASGNGIDPLLINAAQTRRPGRGWWRLLLDLYGAADVAVAEVQLRRLYPGGPAIGRFTVRHGPDGTVIDRFTLKVERSGLLPRLMQAGVARADAALVAALRDGRLQPDPTLVIEEPEILLPPLPPAPPPAPPQRAPSAGSIDRPGTIGPSSPAGFRAISVGIETPDAGMLDAAESALRGVAGVGSAQTTSQNVGGTSVVRIIFSGDLAALRSALGARGWTLEGEGTSLRMRRAGAAPDTPPPPPPTSDDGDDEEQ